MNIEWRFQDGASGGAVTAFFGRCRVTQYSDGSVIAREPSGLTEEEKAVRRTLFDRAAATGKIWMDAT